MKKIVFLLLVSLFFPLTANAKDFLGAPVIPQGKAIQKTDSRLELKTLLSHDEVVSFYREALKGFENIKFREWKDATYIEDDGKMPWHSITISKGGKESTDVVIVKDNWTWIIWTLVLRYIGVFIVLMILFIGMSVSGKIISRSVQRMGAKKAANESS
jgi:hypothetical protein